MNKKKSEVYVIIEYNKVLCNGSIFSDEMTASLCYFFVVQAKFIIMVDLETPLPALYKQRN